jgi:hypothetical protein
MFDLGRGRLLTIIIPPLLTQAMFIEVFAGEDRIGAGTGFIVEGPTGRVLLSNRHVIVGREPSSNEYKDKGGRQPDRIKVWSVDRSAQPTVVEMRLFDAAGTEQWIEHPQHRHHLDLVGMLWPHTEFRSTRTGTLAASGAPVRISVPDPVLLLGFPLRFHGGIHGLPVAVSGMIASTPGLSVDGDLPRFLIDSATIEGLSGSPVLFYPNGQTVINERGTTATAVLTKDAYQLLGLYTGRIRGDAQLGYVIDVGAIRELLANPQRGVLLPT